METATKTQNSELEIWHFLSKELSKLYDIVDCYDKIYLNIGVKNNKYNLFFQLILDGFTRNIAITLDILFQKRKGVWSLYGFDEFKSEIDLIRKRANYYLMLRNNKFGHLSQNFIHSGNFYFFNKAAIDEIREIINDVAGLLAKISKSKGKNESYAMGFIGLDSSIDVLFRDLKR
jgi:hypothetical protein